MLETLKLFQDNDNVIEIRIIGKSNYSGYFKDPETAVKEVLKYDGKNNNIYFIFNKIHDACYHRENKDKMVEKSQNTSDNDIVKRQWVLIDFDPIRPSKISSTDVEKKASEDVMRSAYKYLKKAGFSDPVVADSGNGWHLLYKLDSDNDADTRKAVEGFLKSCDMLFSNSMVSVDKTVFNAGRITKLYGTMAVKGTNTEERPHRRSKITYIPENLVVTSLNRFKGIADLMPKVKKVEGDFNLDDFISRHGINVSKVTQWDGGTRYILSECPFDGSHGKDSAIMQLTTGALVFHCFHNGCSDNDWKAFRELYEPDREKYEPRTEYKKQEIPVINIEIPKELDAATRQILKNATLVSKIKPVNMDHIEVLKTGTKSVDNSSEIYFGTLAVISGSTGGGKSTWLGQLMLEALEQKHNVFTYSGELKCDNFQYWVDCQAGGKKGLERQERRDTGKVYYTLKRNIQTQIHDWYGERFWLYDNNQSMKYADLLKTIEAFRVHHGTRVMFIDNFLTMDVSDLSDNDLKAQTGFILHLSKYCKTNNVIVFLVIHPKKTGRYAVTKSDVLGSGSLTAAIDYLYIVHKVNESFKLSLRDRPFSKETKEMLESANGVIEIAKDRHSPSEGLNVPIMYVESSRRFIELGTEDLPEKQYGWNNNFTRSEEQNPFEN